MYSVASIDGNLISRCVLETSTEYSHWRQFAITISRRLPYLFELIIQKFGVFNDTPSADVLSGWPLGREQPAQRDPRERTMQASDVISETEQEILKIPPPDDDDDDGGGSETQTRPVFCPLQVALAPSPLLSRC